MTVDPDNVAVMAEPGLLLDDRYRLDDRIAAGGMGEVWQATDLALHRQVAVKLMRPGYAQDPEGLARFRAEARYAGSLAHPNIAMIYDFWEGDPPGQPYLVMELVNGPSLAKVLTQGPMGPVTTLDVIAQTAAGLQAAHQAGLVHRDIKPANLLISPGGQIKISDFGIARADSSATLTGTGMVVGTAAYLAPERVSGQPATPASDLYALGIVAHECLTGQRPFDGDAFAVALAHLQQELPPLPPSVPAEVARLVAALTAKNPRARPPSAGSVAQRAAHLQAVLTGRAAIETTGLAPPAPGSPSGAAFPAAGAAFPASGAPTWAARPGDTLGTGQTAGLPRTLSDSVPGATAPGGTVPGNTVPGGTAPGGPDGEPAEERGRRRWLLLGAGAAGAAVVAVAAWLMLAPGSAPQPPAARSVRAPHSSAPASPAPAPPTSLASAAQPQPRSDATASEAPSPPVSPAPSATTPTPQSSPTAATTPAATATATATATTGSPTASPGALPG